MKDYVVKHGTSVRVSERYHKFNLFFKYINIKEAILF